MRLGRYLASLIFGGGGAAMIYIGLFEADAPDSWFNKISAAVFGAFLMYIGWAIFTGND